MSCGKAVSRPCLRASTPPEAQKANPKRPNPGRISPRPAAAADPALIPQIQPELTSFPAKWLSRRLCYFPSTAPLPFSVSLIFAACEQLHITLKNAKSSHTCAQTNKHTSFPSPSSTRTPPNPLHPNTSSPTLSPRPPPSPLKTLNTHTLPRLTLRALLPINPRPLPSPYSLKSLQDRTFSILLAACLTCLFAYYYTSVKSTPIGYTIESLDLKELENLSAALQHEAAKAETQEAGPVAPQTDPPAATSTSTSSSTAAPRTSVSRGTTKAAPPKREDGLMPFEDEADSKFDIAKKIFLPENVSRDVDGPPLKKILFWNDAYSNKDFGFGFGREPFIRAGCRVNTCLTTGKRDRFPLKELDAVIWHFRANDKSLPAERYNRVYRRRQPLHISRNYTEGKTKLAAWFVTNCHTIGGRESLVSTLKKWIDIDVYGGCGHLKCERSQQSECHRMLNRTYKFYLSFENSLCQDYVTEKFFNILRLDVVPVVYGLGNYSVQAPDHSYIDALSFPTAKDLADYLLYLDGNDTAYNEYFNKWFLSLFSLKSLLPPNVSHQTFSTQTFPTKRSPPNVSHQTFPTKRSPHKRFPPTQTFPTNRLPPKTFHPTVHQPHPSRWKTDYFVSKAWVQGAQAYCALCESLHNDNATKVYDLSEWFVQESRCLEETTPEIRDFIGGFGHHPVLAFSLRLLVLLAVGLVLFLAVALANRCKSSRTAKL
ncbi:hypothetical protein C7M84_014043 [Penaeus vannamei]|uniref:Fucosyltransferase n=1 Tax=Penaeus vannamei TaxID=6689 RepID=A0A423U9S1_PENVA|nr:hypothetical protein C7M84_014043 [Penaeus vannamei]